MVASAGADASKDEGPAGNLRSRARAGAAMHDLQPAAAAAKAQPAPDAERADGPSSGQGGGGGGGGGGTIDRAEFMNMALLVLLYAVQGIPLGLTFGAM
jgi:hypothetical protein